MERLNRIINWIADALFALALLCGALMMLHVTADVFSRTVLNAPLPGTGEITATYYMIALVFLPFAWITLRDQHVTADIFVEQMSAMKRRIIGVMVDILSITYVSAFVWQSWLSALSRTQRGEVWEIQGGYLPIWPTRWILPIAGAVMVAVLVLRLVQKIFAPSDKMEGVK